MKNKVAIILGSNIHWAPYYYRYEKILIDQKVPFDLIYWNRENILEETKANIISFNIPDISNNKNPLKIFKFVAFSNFVKRTIKKNKYDKLIFLGTHGCAVSFCSRFLEKHYKNRIWIDIRDDQYEWFPPFYSGEKRSIEASYATAISSHQYESFLPKHDYLFIHNIDPNAEKMKDNYHHKEDERIRISFIGNVRYYEQNLRLIKLLGNDNRFRLQYYGKGSDDLKQYCEENKITNLDFVSFFPQSDTLKYYEQTDIVNNNYGNNTLNLRTALSNKLYYSLVLHLPILVSDNTYMKALTEGYDMCFTFKEASDFGDKLEKWYHKIQNRKITPKYDELWKIVKTEDEKCIDVLKEFILLRL